MSKKKAVKMVDAILILDLIVAFILTCIATYGYLAWQETSAFTIVLAFWLGELVLIVVRQLVSKAIEIKS